MRYTLNTLQRTQKVLAKDAKPCRLYRIMNEGYMGQIVLMAGVGLCRTMVSLTHSEHFWNDITKNDLELEPLEEGESITLIQED